MVVSMLWLAGCTPVPPPPGHPVEATVEELMTFPKLFDGRAVSVTGYLLICWEGGGLFSSSEAAKAYDFRHGITTLPHPALGKAERFWGVYGPVEGTFHAYDGNGEPWLHLVVETVRPRGRFEEYVEPRESTGQSPEEVEAGVRRSREARD